MLGQVIGFEPLSMRTPSHIIILRSVLLRGVYGSLQFLHEIVGAAPSMQAAFVELMASRTLGSFSAHVNPENEAHLLPTETVELPGANPLHPPTKLHEPPSPIPPPGDPPPPDPLPPGLPSAAPMGRLAANQPPIGPFHVQGK